MLTNILILGAGVMIGTFISNKANKKDYKMCETPESVVEDMKDCLNNLYEQIKNITVDDVKNSLLKKYQSIKRKIDSIDFSQLKEKSTETIENIKKSLKKLKNEVENTKQD